MKANVHGGSLRRHERDDPDDNAFTDCAITAGADCIITDDAHFAPLANAGYKPQPITPAEFIERYRGIHA